MLAFGAHLGVYEVTGSLGAAEAHAPSGSRSAFRDFRIREHRLLVERDARG
jgi:hypothetical protein